MSKANSAANKAADRGARSSRASGLSRDHHERGQQGKRRAYPLHHRSYAYRSSSQVDRLDESHPGIRALVETLLRKRVRLVEIAREVSQQFGERLSTKTLSRFFIARIQPQEHEEAEAFRQAHAQARVLIEEMKADPSLDAAQIAEIMLANQIVHDRTKLAEADIMDLYREQRERRKLELQQKAYLLKERQALALLEKLEKGKKRAVLSEETLRKIKEMYGIYDPPPAVESAGEESSS